MRIATVVAAFALYAGSAFAQVDTAWVRNLSGPVAGYHSGNAIWSMPDGGAAVAGEVVTSNGKSDIVTSRISPTGDEMWARYYDGSFGGFDAGRLVQTDSSGNIYVAGNSEYQSGQRHVVLLKYSPDGDVLWTEEMDLGSTANLTDSVCAMCLDNNGNIVVTGMANLFQWTYPIFVRKYDPDGNLTWNRTYEYTSHNMWHDVPYAIACDGENNIYVAGGTQTPDWDFLTIKYTSSGYRMWVRIHDSPWHGDDLATALAIDDAGSVYVTGASIGDGDSEDYLTLKFDSLGVVQWTRRYIGPAVGADIPIGIGVDDAGAIYVGGKSRGFFTLDDFHIIKYDTLSIPVWDRQYTGPGFSVEIPNSFRVTAGGVTYISGASSSGSSSWEFATVSFDSSGLMRWERRYGGSITDSAASMHLDESGNVFVTGTGQPDGTNEVITTVKYAPCGPPAVVDPPVVTSNATPCAGEPFTLSWSSSPGATSYELYEDGGFLSTGPDTFKTIVRANGSYTYTVRARHSACGVSTHSVAGGQTTIQCQCHGDSNCDGAINVVDVTSTINEAFRGAISTPDAGCINNTRNDVDCDCVVSLTDIIRIINVAFRGSDKAAEFCLPCAETCP